MKKEMKEQLIREKYLLLASESVEYCSMYNLTFKEWLRRYGLYCTGKEVNADTTELGKALLNATIVTLTDLEEELVLRAGQSIKSDLSLDQASLKLNK